jgi:hypothetical protein
VIGSYASEFYYRSYTVATSGVNRPASQICHNRLFCKKLQQNVLHMISTEVSSLATHNTHDRKTANRKQNDKTQIRSPNFQMGDNVFVAEHRKSGRSKLQVKWKGPRHVASVESDYVFVVENLLTRVLKTAHATRPRFYQDKQLNISAELGQATEYNDHEQSVESKIFDARYNYQEIFYELLVGWRGFPVERGHLGTILSFGCGCSGDGCEVHGVSRRYRHGAQDAISLRVLMRKCYVLLSMRPLSISYAEGFLVIF